MSPAHRSDHLSLQDCGWLKFDIKSFTFLLSVSISDTPPSNIPFLQSPDLEKYETSRLDPNVVISLIWHWPSANFFDLFEKIILSINLKFSWS